ncbi:MAG: hypothetical protein IIW91_05185 [Alistipes sp.]|nr:hypothetical protein [Alistipes sp.]
MRKLSILVAASSMLFAACSKDDSVNQNLAHEKFFASSAVTRTVMGDNGTSVHWVDGDLVSIFNKTSDNLKYQATQVNETTAELVYVAGTRTAATMSSNFALYPYDADATLNSGVIATSIPAAQSFSADASLQHSIMVAKSESNSFSFVNATSLLRFDVKSIIGGATIKSITIQSQANGLAGDVTIDMNEQAPVAEVADGAAKEIVLDCGDAVLSSTDYTSFYAVVPATEFAAGDLKIIYAVNYDGKDVEVEYPVQNAMSLGAGVMKWTQFTISESFSGSTSDMATAISELQSVFENGGEYTLDVDVVLPETLVVKGDVTLNLNGKTLTNAVDNTATDVIIVNEGATLTINGDGVVEAVTGNDGYAVIVKGNLVINGGTFKSGLDADGYQNAVIYARHNDAHITINGGEFRCADADPSLDASRRDYRYTINKWGSALNSVIEIKGGRFYRFNPELNAADGMPTDYMAAGYKAYAVDADWYSVVAPTEVASEAALMSAIAANKPVILTSDIVLDNVLVLNSDATIVLNGKTITSGVFAESNGTINEGTTDSYVFWVKGGTLNIHGDGEINAAEAKYSMAVWADGGTVNIYGGTYKNNNASDLIYAKNGGVVNIYGGEFIASNKNADTEDGTLEEYSALNLHDTRPGAITVYGGSFYKFNPADNLSENPKVNFVAAGYQSVQNGDYWVVSKQ